MTEAWDNAVKFNLNIVTPPSLFLPTTGPKIFLAGSIDKDTTPHWREKTIDYVRTGWFQTSHEDITFYNPRRDDGWDDDWQVEQVAWNIQHLETSDYILMHLAEGCGVSPESLLELGLFMASPKMYISIDIEHPKRYIAEVHIAEYGYHNLFLSLEQSIDAIQLDWKKKDK